VKQPFYGGYGLIAEDGLPKPAFNAFKVLHHLGAERLANDSPSAIVTRRPDGRLAIAVWNLYLPEEAGVPKTVTLVFKDAAAAQTARVSRVDSTHGSVLAAYRAMGSPTNPTQAQITQLRRRAQLPAPSQESVSHGKLTLVLPPQSLALVETQ
jgi:xylan 1,4-beta-xylosidase